MGNAITNLQVHSRLIARNRDAIKLYLLLGDDTAIIARHNLDVVKEDTYIRIYYNMVCKFSTSPDFCTFLQLVIYKDNDYQTYGIGPDYRRLNHKW